jgi:hypothetical protein
MEGLRRHAVAAFVALHLFAVTVCALPSAGSGMNRAAWRQPTVQGEFAAWTRRLNGLGVSVTSEGLQDWAWAVASRHEGVRDAVLAPFRPYFQLCGTWQGWRMFVAPHRFPARAEIEIDRGQGWEKVYVARSADHTWLARQLDHDRFRAALFRYGWDHYRSPRQQYATWVSRQAAAAFPGAIRARISFVRTPTRSPEEVRRGVPPVEERELMVTRALDQYRP